MIAVRSSKFIGTERACERALRARFGVVTVLDEEHDAMVAALEDIEEIAIEGTGAGRRYRVGSVPAAGGTREILLALGEKGNNAAAIRSTLLVQHFPHVEHLLMVGIAGGVPAPENPSTHVALGDVVISNGDGVVQYDFGKELPDGTFEVRPSPRPAAAELLEAARLIRGRPWEPTLATALDRLGIARPDAATDPHAAARPEPRLRTFLAPIAAANRVLTNTEHRNHLRDRFHVRAVEMESSGVADATHIAARGYLTIRGICDYCDGRKNDVWHPYAAATAAAYTRALLESLPLSAAERDGPQPAPHRLVLFYPAMDEQAARNEPRLVRPYFFESPTLRSEGQELKLTISAATRDDERLLVYLTERPSRMVALVHDLTAVFAEVQGREGDRTSSTLVVKPRTIPPPHPFYYNKLTPLDQAVILCRLLLLDEPPPERNAIHWFTAFRGIDEFGFFDPITTRATLPVRGSHLPGLFAATSGEAWFTPAWFEQAARLLAVLHLRWARAVDSIVALELRLEGSLLHVDFEGRAFERPVTINGICKLDAGNLHAP